jgi:hypothetical protein
MGNTGHIHHQFDLRRFIRDLLLLVFLGTFRQMGCAMNAQIDSDAPEKVGTLSGVWLNNLGFWLFLCLLEGTAWVVWTLLEIQNHYYFLTKPLDTFGTQIPW